MAATRLKWEAHMKWLQFRVWSEGKTHTQSCETSCIGSTNPQSNVRGKACCKREDGTLPFGQISPLPEGKTDQLILVISRSLSEGPHFNLRDLDFPQETWIFCSSTQSSGFPERGKTESQQDIGHLHNSLLFLDACAQWSHF